MSTEVQATTNESAPTKRKSSKRASKEASTTTKQSKSGSKKSAKGNSGKKCTKVSTAKAESKSSSRERPNTKKAIVLEMLRRKEGATTAEIAKATEWQNHTIRGFISGTLTKKMGLTVESIKSDTGERTYRIA